MVNGNNDISAKSMMDQLKYGDYTYQGKGEFCEGTHFAYSEKALSQYARSLDRENIVGVISNNAKVLDVDANDNREFQKINTEAEKLHERSNVSLSIARSVLALSKGYDAMRFNLDGKIRRETFGNKSDYICFLKRDNLILKEFHQNE
ncbi:MAG: hypothetical protein IJ122_06100 [Methanobrevibacter sp.]|nr:hypothetical protein [Methanobrevibacter sp.]